MLPTYMSSGIFLCIWCFGLALVQSVPLTRDESSSSESSRCQSYTHWDVSEERCVSCTEECNPGEELKEDCGYSPTGDPIADPCRQCPSGTYSSSGQEQCQACEICPNGYQQECSPTQPAICLCKEDEELAPDGVSCQEICCYCQDPYPNFDDMINDCSYRYSGSPDLRRYRCRKNSRSAGEACKRPPTTPPPAVVSTTTVSPKTTAQLQNVTTTSPAVSNSTSGPGTTAPTVHPLGPTHPATASSGSPPITTEEARTTEGPSTVSPHPLIGPTGKQPPWFIIMGIAGCVVLVIIICCCLRNREKIAGYFPKTDSVETDELLAENELDDGREGEETGSDTEVRDEGREEEPGQQEVKDSDKEVDSLGDADSGTVTDSKDSSDAGSEKNSPFCSKDSLLEPESYSVDSADGQGEDETHSPEHTEETGQPMDTDAQPLGTETTPKGMESCDTIEFAETIEGPPNNPRSLNARPSGGGPNIPQHGGGQPPQPPPYPGNQGQGQGQGAPAVGNQPVVSISGGTFNAPVTFVIGGNNYHNYPAPAAGGPPQDANNRRRADGNADDGAGPAQADGNRRQPAPHNADGRPAHPPSNGNDRPRNRRRAGIQVNILPNPARVGQNVRFSCHLPDNMDPGDCEFRWMKQGQLDQVAQVQNFSKYVQRYDAGVYTCEVTTADGQVLEGQAVLEIIEDGAEGGTSMSGRARRADHNTEQPRKRLCTAALGAPGAQDFSNPRQIQVPEFIQHKPLEEILDHEDLLSNLQVELEQLNRTHWRNIGSHFCLSNKQLNHIEYMAGISKSSPLRVALEKVTSTKEGKTVGDLLKYCNDTLERRDVVHTVVDYFEKEEQENQEGETEVKEGVEEDSFVADRCSEQAKDTDSVEIDELKELRAVTSEADMAINDMPEESVLAQAAARKKLETCDFNSGEFELVELQS